MSLKKTLSPEALIHELNISRKKVQILETAFEDMLEELQFSKKLFREPEGEQAKLFLGIINDLADEIRLTSKQIKALDGDLGEVIDGIFEGERGNLVRELMVRVMNLSLSHWEAVTQTTKIELAEQSKLWKVSIDQGVLRVRTYDRYLTLEKLPKNPKWRDVVRTIRFVLNHSSQSSPVKDELEREFQNLQNLIYKK